MAKREMNGRHSNLSYNAPRSLVVPFYVKSRGAAYKIEEARDGSVSGPCE